MRLELLFRTIVLHHRLHYFKQSLRPVMPVDTSRLALLCSCCLFCSTSFSAPLRFGAAEMPRPDPCLPFVTQTAEWLNESLPDGSTFRYYTRSELEDAVEKGEIDVVLSEAGTASAMRKYGARVLLSAVSLRHPNPARAQGAVFFVRRDSPFQHLSDLANTKLGATSSNDFTGYWAAMGELKNQGYDPESFFGEIDFVGNTSKIGMRHVVHSVEKGVIDVGVARTCFLEDLAKLEGHTANVRVLDPKPQNGFACQRSTDLYPNWTIFSVPNASAGQIRDVVQVLLEMPKTSDGMYWSIAPDFSALDKLLMDLQIGPYEVLRHWTLKRFINEYSTLLIFLATIALALVIHSWRSSVLVRRRTIELKKSFHEQEQLRAKSHDLENRFEQFQKATIVGQLSNIFAHEIKQPLHSMSCYAHGLLRAIDSGNVDQNIFRLGLEKLETNAQDIGRIVDRVREYAKGQSTEKELLNLNDIVQATCQRLVKSNCVDFFPAKENPFVFGNELELQIIFTNIIKNAVQSVRSVERPLVEIRCLTETVADNRYFECTIDDNGPGMDDQKRKALGSTIHTSKKDGLGLGLIVVRGLVERYLGNITFARSELGGLRVVIRLPITNGETSQVSPSITEEGL